MREGVTAAEVSGVISAVLGVVIGTALIAWLHDNTNVPNLSILYLPVILGVASAFGRLAALLAAVLAFLTFDFFFVEPLHTFHVADPQELLALGVLLLTAVVTGQLAATLRARAREAEAREKQMTALYELSRLLGHDGPLEQRLAAAVRRLTEMPGTAGAEVRLLGSDGRLAVRAAHGASAPEQPGVEQAIAAASSRGQPVILGQSSDDRRRRRPLGLSREETAGVLCLPLLVGERRLGVLCLVDSPASRGAGRPERRYFRAVADVLAQAVERERLAADAMDAEVLRRADQMKSALLSSVSHDLRTPLASIKASVTSLLDEGVAWGRVVRREFLLTIDEETDRLTRFVSRLLDLSRVEGGAAQPCLDWHAVEDILVGIAGRLDPTGTRIRIEVPDDLPLAKIDYVMVEQIIANLVENALKYSPPNAPVEVTAAVHTGQLVIEVVDRGAGVPAAERDHIFERFYRANRSDADAPGNGVGLAIARGLAQAHDGDLRYAPRSGGGSIFSVNLPLGVDDRERVAS